MNKKIFNYCEQIRDAITDEAYEKMIAYGLENLYSDEQLRKLFSKRFMNGEDSPSSPDLCLVYNKNNSEMELFSKNQLKVLSSITCDINRVQSIISGAIECINNCVAVSI